MVEQLIVVRHGETDWNCRGLWQGHSGPGLNEKGRRQAELVAERLATMGIEAMYASDLPRAVETAQIISKRLRIEAQSSPRLREQFLGEWEGRSREEMEARYPEMFNDAAQRGLRFRPHGGESTEEVRARVLAEIDRIAGDNPHRRVLVVTHGGVLRVIIYSALGLDFSARRRFVMPNGATFVFGRDEWGWRVITLNDGCHLEERADEDGYR